MNKDTPIVSARKYSDAERRYREEKRWKQREERNARKAAEHAAYLESLKTRYFVNGETAQRWNRS